MKVTDVTYNVAKMKDRVHNGQESVTNGFPLSYVFSRFFDE